jgi:hypothetical protein
MIMKSIKILLGLAVVTMVLILTGTMACGDPPQEASHRSIFQFMGPSGISGNQQHLYVLAGGKIMQYSLADLKFLKSVALPKAEPPGESKPFPTPGPHGIWAGEKSLFVLTGPRFYEYSIPDLTFKTSVALPQPDSSGPTPSSP